MRQPAVDPAPALRSLIGAIPDDRLRELVLEMLLASLTAKAPIAHAEGRKRPDAPPIAAAAPAKQRGWPLGKPRGPRKATEKATKTKVDEAEAKLAQQRQRDAAKKREKRAAARAVRQAKPNSSNGTEAAVTKSAAKLWQHAERLEPKAPWRAIVREFGINEALAQDAYRAHTLPLGLTGNAVTHFLELPVS
jgi:hypothetical protein